ncbi:MAG: hypothetical protein WDN00_19180 [Limisphaerales bacterium]
MKTMKLNRLLVTVAIGGMLMMILDGCASTQSRQLGIIHESGKFYKMYLGGDVNQARQNLELVIQLYQNQKVKILGRSGQAGDLFCSYARLYVLEKKVGNKDDTEAALIRARYWQLESYESSDDGWKNRTPMNEFMATTTPEKISEMVDKLDEGSTGGKGPTYIQYLTHTQPKN